MTRAGTGSGDSSPSEAPSAIKSIKLVSGLCKHSANRCIRPERKDWPGPLERPLVYGTPSSPQILGIPLYEVWHSMNGHQGVAARPKCVLRNCGGKRPVGVLVASGTNNGLLLDSPPSTGSRKDAGMRHHHKCRKTRSDESTNACFAQVSRTGMRDPYEPFCE